MNANCCASCGAPAPNPIQGPNNSVPLKPGPRTPTTLVTDPNYRPQLTATRDVDLHTAMARGLAEYLGQQSIDIGGRRLQLTTFSTWAEPEDKVNYPAAGVGAGAGRYDRSFTPHLVTTIGADVRLFGFSEFQQELTVELWATDPKERAYLVAMIEEALSPVDWMYGCRLALPFYHGTTATYELLTSQYLDSADDAMKRYRRAQFTISGSIQALRLLKLPDSQPRARVDVFDAAVVLPTTS